MLKSAGLILNSRNHKAVACAEKAADFFHKNNIFSFNPLTDKPDEQPGLIVSFGGDGTLLLGARYAIQYDIPLLGINLGTVGFLTAEAPDHLEETLQAIIESRYQTEDRSLLRVYNSQTDESFYALNDAVITRGGYARLIRVDAFVNQK